MRALSSYDFPSIAANLGAAAWRRTKSFVRIPVRWGGLGIYCVLGVLMLLATTCALLLAAASRALLPREYAHVDERLTTILEQVLQETPE